jgi:type II secretory pathway component PulC
MILLALLLVACDRASEPAVQTQTAPPPVSSAETKSDPATAIAAEPKPDAPQAPPSTLGPSNVYAVRLTDELFWLERGALTEALAEAAAGHVRVEKADTGWRIVEIAKDCLAGTLGLHLGDVVRVVAKHPIADADAWVSSVRELSELDRFDIELDRAGRPLVLHYEIRDELPGSRDELHRVLAIVRLGVDAKADRIAIDRVVLQQLASSGLVERLRADQRRQLLDALGIDDSDVVAVADASVDGPPATLVALGRQATATEFGVEVATSSGVTKRLTVQVVEGRIVEADLAAAIARLPAGVVDAGGESVGIVEVDETHYTIPKALREELNRDPSKFLATMRIVPTHVDGKVTGIKLYGIRSRGSLSAQWVGLRNGDVVSAINGVKIGGMEDALAGYDKARKSDVVTVEIVRRTKPIVLTWTFE